MLQLVFRLVTKCSYRSNNCLMIGSYTVLTLSILLFLCLRF